MAGDTLSFRNIDEENCKDVIELPATLHMHCQLMEGTDE